MKQYLTKKQLQELSETDRKHFSTWLSQKEYLFEITSGKQFNIGLLIDFLKDKKFNPTISYGEGVWCVDNSTVADGTVWYVNKRELINSLWEAVKHVLFEIESDIRWKELPKLEHSFQ